MAEGFNAGQVASKGSIVQYCNFRFGNNPVLGAPR